MKCPYCNGDHPDEFKYCPSTGKEIKSQFKACTNESCRDYGKYILPLEARFCPECGSPINERGGKADQKKESNDSTAPKIDFSKAFDEINTLFNLKK